MEQVAVIGAGLAGCEAAWQLSKLGVPVRLIEMKPGKRSPAHVINDFAELVCSNSLRSDELHSAVGLLKAELRRLGSLIMLCADRNAVAAGGALAVDREAFASDVTAMIRSRANIEVVEEEAVSVPDGVPVIIATGPLTSDAMAKRIAEMLAGQNSPDTDSDARVITGDTPFLNFYDASAPIVTLESIDMESAYFASRYDKGTRDYINCPLNRDEYLAFWSALRDAEEAAVHGFEDAGVFEGCMPAEVMARRGEDTLRYGPMKPVGLRDPRTGREAYAALQLRRDNASGTLFNIVGFQTHLKFGEQRRVLSMIPALRNAEFVRYGVMHRNTYIDSPRLLDRYYRLKERPNINFAGQITGVEGYVESCASGMLVGLETARRCLGFTALDFPAATAIGALARYVSDASVTDFQPMNINFGIIEPLGRRVKGKRQKNLEISNRALETIDGIAEKCMTQGGSDV